MKLLQQERFVQSLRFAHRQGGLILSFFLLLLTISGVLLNHTVDFGLHDKSVPPTIAARYYSAEAVYGYNVDSHYFYVLGDALFMDNIAVTVCAGDLSGVVTNAGEFVIGCDNELILVSAEGVYIERLGSAHGVPLGLSGVGQVKDKVLLRASNTSTNIPTIYAFDPVTLSTTTLSTTTLSTTLEETARGEFPDLEVIPANVVLKETVSWEQFILDLHSGHFLGQGGVWLMDFVALLLVLLAISGIIMFLLPRRNKP